MIRPVWCPACDRPHDIELPDPAPRLQPIAVEAIYHWRRPSGSECWYINDAAGFGRTEFFSEESARSFLRTQGLDGDIEITEVAPP